MKQQLYKIMLLYIITQSSPSKMHAMNRNQAGISTSYIVVHVYSAIIAKQIKVFLANFQIF